MTILENIPRPLTRKSPMKYVGGKYRARKIIRSYFPKGLIEMVSPFLGAGHIELDCAADGIVVHGSDIYKELINFWDRMKADPQAVKLYAMTYYPMTHKQFLQMFDEYDSYVPNNQAAAFWAIHKCSFAGRGFTDPSRWYNTTNRDYNLNQINLLGEYYNPLLLTKNWDYETALVKHFPDLFAYCDPPYLMRCKNNFYGRDGSLHKEFDHERLAKVLRGRDNWILSYNDCEEIRDLYSGYEFQYPQWKYGMTDKTKSNEVLILNVSQ